MYKIYLPRSQTHAPTSTHTTLNLATPRAGIEREEKVAKKIIAKEKSERKK